MTSAFQVFNQEFSCKGPLVLPIDLNFSAQLVIELDLTETIDRGVLDFISSIYINNRGRSQTILCQTNLVGQEVFARADTIGYYPLMVGNSPKFTFTASSLITDPVRVIFSNIPYYPFIN